MKKQVDPKPRKRSSELVFLVEDAPEGGYTARALGESIFTESETRDELAEAVRCHFEEQTDLPKVIRLHYVHDEEHPPCVVPG